jgi:hypothetical protein
VLHGQIINLLLWLRQLVQLAAVLQSSSGFFMHLQASLFDQCGVPASVYHIWCMVRALRCLLSFASHLVGICAAFSTIWHCSCLYGSVRYCSAGWVAVCAVVGELPPGASALPNFCGAAYLQPIRPIKQELWCSLCCWHAFTMSVS